MTLHVNANFQTSIKMKLLCVQVIKDLIGGEIDVSIIHFTLGNTNVHCKVNGTGALIYGKIYSPFLTTTLWTPLLLNHIKSYTTCMYHKLSEMYKFFNVGSDSHILQP